MSLTIADAIEKASKEYLAAKGVESADKLSENEKAELIKLQTKAMGEAMVESAAKNLETVKSSVEKTVEELRAENLKTTANLEQYKQKAEEFAVMLQTVSAKQASGAYGENPRVAKAIEEVKAFHKDVIAAAKANKEGVFTIKADTLTTAVADSTRGVMDSEVARLANRRLTAYDAVGRKITIPPNMGGTYRYLDQDSGTSIRAAANIAEGAASPESTIAWEQKSLDLKKISDNIPYSDEFEYDFRDLMMELLWWLRTNVEIQIDDQLINGDGLTDNFTGFLTSIPAYTPVASGISDPNLFDLMVKVKESAEATEGSKYNFDVVMLNSADITSTNWLLKKDANDNYVDLATKAAAYGITVITNNSLAANVMIMGDSRYARIIQDGVIRVTTGIKINAEGIEGVSRMLVETRKNLLIRDLEATGWREVTSISAALTTLGTP